MPKVSINTATVDELIRQIQQRLYEAEDEKNQVKACNWNMKVEMEKMRAAISNKDYENRRLHCRVEELIASKMMVQADNAVMRQNVKDMDVASRQIEIASSVMDKVITDYSNEGVVKEEAGAGHSAMEQDWAGMPSVAKKMTQLAMKLRAIFD